MLSRRHVLALGFAAACCGSSAADAQPAATAPARVIRAQPRASFTGASGDASPSLWGYEGTVPGPVLRARRGEELRVRLVNALSEPTSIHWHGVRVPNVMDGVPGLTQAPVEPGASFEYVFRATEAGTFWYHASLPAHVGRGLYGALIIEEGETIDVDRDLLLVLGAPAETQAQAREPVLVNGSRLPDIPVRAGERVRLRLINAGIQRGFSLKLAGLVPWVAAIDGQAVDPFLPHEGRIGVMPGGRIDVFADMRSDTGAALLLAGVRDEYPIARFVQDGAGVQLKSKRQPQPAPLPSNPLPARIDLKNAVKAELNLGDAVQGDLPRAPLFAVNRGRSLSLGIHNTGARPHVLHLHGHHFRLLDRLDDGWKPYWLDTLVVGEAVERIAFVADNPGRWLIECRMLERPDAGGAAWFAVT
jgi:FtsP/CotA-like multicopper oxidase with cupredoxin domain